MTKKMNTAEIISKDYAVYDFKGKWANIFKQPGLNFSAMVYGTPGQGKTAMSCQLAQYLAENFGNVLYVSGEEHDSKSLQDNIIKNGVRSSSIDWVQDWKDEDLSQYDFVFFDSVNNLRMSINDFIRLKDEYPQTALILIFQATKDGQFRGDNTWKHEVDAVIKVKDGKAINEKRYSGGLLMGIF